MNHENINILCQQILVIIQIVDIQNNIVIFGQTIVLKNYLAEKTQNILILYQYQHNEFEDERKMDNDLVDIIGFE
jgi:hypothetical protein